MANTWNIVKNIPLPLKWKCDKRKNYNQGLSLKYQSLYPIPTFSLFWEMTQFSSILMEKFNRILFYYTILDNASISLKQRWFSKPQISTITYQLIISYSAILCIIFDGWCRWVTASEKGLCALSYTNTKIRRLINTNH